MQISYILANVFEDTPNPADLVKPEHRKLAEDFMQAVDSCDCGG